MDDDDIDLQEQIFYNIIREHVICYLLFLGLFISSYIIICRYKRTVDDYVLTDDANDIILYNTSVLICSIALATTIGQILLLPFSIISNEILLMYSNSYYVKWLNQSLVQGLWNYIFLLSNGSLFFLLPFAIFLIQSVGFSHEYKDLKSRLLEAVVQLSLIALVIFGIAYILSKIFNFHTFALSSLFDLRYFWNHYLPVLYACISFVGCSLSLICTPLGFAHFFTVVGGLLIKPKFRHNLDDEILMARFEEMTIERKIERLSFKCRKRKNSCLAPCCLNGSPAKFDNVAWLKKGVRVYLENKLERVRDVVNSLEKQKANKSYLPNGFIYVITMILLVGLTVGEVLLVLTNTIELLIGYKALPKSSRKFTLGITSLSILGMYGACFEVILILYLLLTSIVGVYSLPIMNRIRPRLGQTPFYHIIGNCFLLLTLSSALPLLSKILGITNFDLLGNFGQIEWLGNFKIILLYNILFIVMAMICLTCKATLSFYEEVLKWLATCCCWIIKMKMRLDQTFQMIPPEHFHRGLSWRRMD